MNDFDEIKYATKLDYEFKLKKFLSMRSRGKTYSSKLVELMLESRFYLDLLSDDSLKKEYLNRLELQLDLLDMNLIGLIREMQFSHKITIHREIMLKINAYSPMFQRCNTFGYYKVDNWYELFEYYNQFTYGYELDIMERAIMGRNFMYYLVKSDDDRLRNVDMYRAIKDIAFSHNIFNMDEETFDFNFNHINIKKKDDYENYTLSKYLTKSDILNSEIPFSEAVRNYEEVFEFEMEYPNIKLMIDEETCDKYFNEINLFMTTTLMDNATKLTCLTISKFALTYIRYIYEKYRTTSDNCQSLKNRYRITLWNFFKTIANSEYLVAMYTCDEAYMVSEYTSDFYIEVQRVLCSYMRNGRYGIRQDNTGSNSYRVLSMHPDIMMSSFVVLSKIIYSDSKEDTIFRQKLIDGENDTLDCIIVKSLVLLLMSFGGRLMDDAHTNKLTTTDINGHINLVPFLYSLDNEECKLLLKLISNQLVDLFIHEFAFNNTNSKLQSSIQVLLFDIAFLLPALNGTKFRKHYSKVTGEYNPLSNMLMSSRYTLPVTLHSILDLSNGYFTSKEHLFMLQLYNDTTHLGLSTNLFKTIEPVENLWLSNYMTQSVLEKIITVRNLDKTVMYECRLIAALQLEAYLDEIKYRLTLNDFIILTNDIYDIFRRLVANKYSYMNSFFRNNWVNKVFDSVNYYDEMYNDFHCIFRTMNKLHEIFNDVFAGKMLPKYVFNDTWIYSIISSSIPLFKNVYESVKYSGHDCIEKTNTDFFKSRLYTFILLIYNNCDKLIFKKLKEVLESSSIEEIGRLITPSNKGLPKFESAKKDTLFSCLTDVHPDNSGLRVYDVTLDLLQLFAPSEEEARDNTYQLLISYGKLLFETIKKGGKAIDFYSSKLFNENLRFLSVEQFVYMYRKFKVEYHDYYNNEPYDSTIEFWLLNCVDYDRLRDDEIYLLCTLAETFDILRDDTDLQTALSKRPSNKIYFNVNDLCTTKLHSICNFLNLVDESLPDVANTEQEKKVIKTANKIQFKQNFIEVTSHYSDIYQVTLFELESDILSDIAKNRFYSTNLKSLMTIQENIKYVYDVDSKSEGVLSSLTPIAIEFRIVDKDGKPYAIQIMLTNTTYRDKQGMLSWKSQFNYNLALQIIRQKLGTDVIYDIMSKPYDEMDIAEKAYRIYEELTTKTLEAFEDIVTENSQVLVFVHELR